jgi:hypothetical protein
MDFSGYQSPISIRRIELVKLYKRFSFWFTLVPALISIWHFTLGWKYGNGPGIFYVLNPFISDFIANHHLPTNTLSGFYIQWYALVILSWYLIGLVIDKVRLGLSTQKEG